MGRWNLAKERRQSSASAVATGLSNAGNYVFSELVETVDNARRTGDFDAAVNALELLAKAKGLLRDGRRKNAA